MSSSAHRWAHLVPLIAVQAFGLACGLVSVRWSSALLPPDVLGLFGLLISTQLFGTTVTHQGVIKHLQRAWTPDLPVRSYLRRLARAAVPANLLLAAGLTLFFALLIINTPGEFSFAWWPWLIAVNFAVVLAHLAHAAVQAEERYWAHFLIFAVGAATRSFLPLALAASCGLTVAMLGGGFFLHTVIWAAVGFYGVRAAWQRQGAVAATPADAPTPMITAFIGAGLCGWLGLTAPRLLAPLILSPDDTGYFMLALNLAGVIPAAVCLIGLSYTFPPLLAAARTGAHTAQLLATTNRTVLNALLIGQIALGLLAFSGPHLVGLIIDPRYTSSLQWLLAAGGGILASVSHSFYGNLLIALNRETTCFRLSAFSAGFRLTAMAALAFTGHGEWFRLGLTLLPWPTAALEAWLVGRWVRVSEQKHP